MFQVGNHHLQCSHRRCYAGRVINLFNCQQIMWCTNASLGERPCLLVYCMVIVVDRIRWQVIVLHIHNYIKLTKRCDEVFCLS